MNGPLLFQLYIPNASSFTLNVIITSIPLLHVRIFTGRNEVVAKVMFLQVCVCPQGGGGRVSASVHAGMPYPPDEAAPPAPGRPPREQADPPGPGRHPPRPGRPPDQVDIPQTR